MIRATATVEPYIALVIEETEDGSVEARWASNVPDASPPVIEITPTDGPAVLVVLERRDVWVPLPKVAPPRRRLRLARAGAKKEGS